MTRGGRAGRARLAALAGLAALPLWQGQPRAQEAAPAPATTPNRLGGAAFLDDRRLSRPSNRPIWPTDLR